MWLTKGGGFFNPQRTMGGILDTIPVDGRLRCETLPPEPSSGTDEHRARALIEYADARL